MTAPYKIVLKDTDIYTVLITELLTPKHENTELSIYNVFLEFFDLGIYGIPKAIEDKDYYNPSTSMRKFEQFSTFKKATVCKMLLSFL